ncbi:P-loop containing nucleoside triphosphate hydrolase protein [Tricholoma matsutake]|nr:P-loop containing nucleoside triphosphate hydrolase protein [Tricholoma matsutake 945]
MKAQQTTSTRTVTIAVMGTTGSGKSTFINLVSGSDLKVSNHLGSCTEEVAESDDFELDGRTLRLLDTPGFDDTDRSEFETLKKIATSLEYQYRNGIILHGIIYLHRISDNRMGGASTRSFRLFRKLCGDDVMTNVIIVTNMWSKVSFHEGEMRELQLTTDDRFFKPAMDRGARIFRHDHTAPCALDILRHILHNNPRPLAIQRELVNEQKHICDSEAGREVNHRLRAFTRKCTEDMISLKAELQEVMKERDEKAEKELSDELQKLTTGLARAKDELAMLTSDHYAEEGTMADRDREVRKPGHWNRIRSAAYLAVGHKSPKPQGKVENVKEFAGVSFSAAANVRIVIHHKSTSL